MGEELGAASGKESEVALEGALVEAGSSPILSVQVWEGMLELVLEVALVLVKASPSVRVLEQALELAMVPPLGKVLELATVPALEQASVPALASALGKALDEV